MDKKDGSFRVKNARRLVDKLSVIDGRKVKKDDLIYALDAAYRMAVGILRDVGAGMGIEDGKKDSAVIVKLPIVIEANKAADECREIPCPECGRMFKPFTYDKERGRYTGVFCCIDCAMAWYNEHPEFKKKDKPKDPEAEKVDRRKTKEAVAVRFIEKRCKKCGKTFLCPATKGGTMYCSDECKAIVQKALKIKKNEKRRFVKAARRAASITG